MSGFTDGFTADIKQKQKQKKLHPRVMDVIIELKRVVIPGTNKPVFSYNMPKGICEYTKGIGAFQDKMNSLYDGTFATYYKIDPEFKEKDVFRIPDNYKARLRLMKGDWDLIKIGLIKAAQNYSESFLLPEKVTKWLPRDVSKWVHNAWNNSSVMTACLFIREGTE